MDTALFDLFVDSFWQILLPGLTVTIPLTAIAFSGALGIAVVIEPPLPLVWAKTYILKAETVESEVHILENVMLQNTQETAYSLLESLAKSLHEERCDELGGAVITLGSVRDESPADEPVLHFVLPLTNALNL